MSLATPPVAMTLRDLSERVGQRLGPTPPQRVDQAMVDRFADATGDHQWIHVDRERAAAGPFGQTIAHGHLTLALIPAMLRTLIATPQQGMTINYGLNRVRFPSPVKVGAELELVATVASVEPVDPGGLQVVLDSAVTVVGAPKPACVAICVLRWYPAAV